jgi:hypothetical protein
MLFNVIFGLQQVAELSDSHRCIALDNRGVGGMAQPWTVESLSADLIGMCSITAMIV